MPRFPRNYLQTDYLHIITQGINKKYIFEKEEDIKYYIKIMYELTKEQKVKIIAYCIMNNHAHILIQTERVEELSKYMQRLNTKYGIYYNKKYNRVGYVFRNRYKSEGIYSEEHMNSCIKYIYENPVKAGICNKAEEYKYSNYKKVDKNLNMEYIFLEFDKDNKKEWRSFIDNYLLENNIKVFELIKDKQKLKNLIKILKDEYNVSLRKISEELNIGREKTRQIYNK